MEKIIRAIGQYQPFNEQEAADQSEMLHLLGTYKEKLFLRETLFAHMTSSAWVVSGNRKEILMAYHNIYQAWSWLGGHADGDTDLLRVAVREVMEESGIKSVRPLLQDIFSLEILCVDGHVKRGKYVPSHLHLNVTYLLEADQNDPLRVKKDENSAVRWIERSSAPEISDEIWFREHIYRKLNQKLEGLNI